MLAPCTDCPTAFHPGVQCRGPQPERSSHAKGHRHIPYKIFSPLPGNIQSPLGADDADAVSAQQWELRRQLLRQVRQWLQPLLAAGWHVWTIDVVLWSSGHGQSGRAECSSIFHGRLGAGVTVALDLTVGNLVGHPSAQPVALESLRTAATEQAAKDRMRVYAYFARK